MGNKKMRTATKKSSAPHPRRRVMRQRTKALRDAIGAMDFVTSGTLHTRTKCCGNPNCRCATDPAARHGPYFEWSRRKDNRLVHKIVSPQQAAYVAQAIANHREIRKLLALWEEETVATLLDTPPA
jgi:hypothetical protein